MRLNQRMIDRRKYNILYMWSIIIIMLLSYGFITQAGRNVRAEEFISPLGRDPIVIEKEVEVPVAEPVPVSYKSFHCMDNYPDVVEKIKMYFGKEWIHATELYCRESSLNYLAINPSSGACGLVQALPCAKTGCDLNDLDCQLRWGKKYIENRYGTAENAVKFHDNNNWY